MRIVVGTYAGLLYGWNSSPSIKDPSKMELKLAFGYGAHPSCVKSVALMQAKQGDILMSGGDDEIIKIYNVKKRVEIGSLMHHKGAITCLEFFGQTHVLTGSTDNTVCIWRTSDWSLLHILGGHKGEVNAIAVHPSGKLALSVAKDRTLRMWNLIKGRCAYIRRLEAEASSVFLSPDGSKYGLTMDRNVVLFNAADGTICGKLEHKQRVQCAAFVSNDMVATGGDDKKLRVWSVDGALKAMVINEQIKTRIRDLKIVKKESEKQSGSEELPYIVLASSDGVVVVYDCGEILALSSTDTKEIAVIPVASALIGASSRITSLTACQSTSSDFKVEDDASTPLGLTVAEAATDDETIQAPAAVDKEDVKISTARIVVEDGFQNSSQVDRNKKRKKDNWKKLKEKKKNKIKSQE